MMQIIIVADERLQDFGRKWAHIVACQEGCDGAFWTLKSYKDNEANLRGDQPIIFIGESDYTKPLMEALCHEAFSSYGTKLLYGGGKAILTVDTPALVSRDDINQIRSANRELVQQIEATDRAPEKRNKALLTAGIIAAWAVGAGVIGLAVYGSYRGIKHLVNKSKEYKKLQYQHAVLLFVKDELDKFISEVKRAQGEDATIS